MFRSFFALLVVCCTTALSAEGYSFSIEDSSIIIHDRTFPYYIDEHQGQTLFRTYLPGDVAGSGQMLIIVQYKDQEIMVRAKAVAEKNNLVINTKIFFSLDNIYRNYERAVFPGVLISDDDDATEEQINDIIKNATDWKIIKQ